MKVRKLILQILLLLLIIPAPLQAASTDKERPVYIITHRVNDVDEIKPVLDQGVNGIEADFRYGGGARKTGWYLAHDTVLLSSETLDEWLNGLVEAIPGSSLSLLHIDIKTPDAPLDVLFNKIKNKVGNLRKIYDIGLVENGVQLDSIKDLILKDPNSVAAMGFDDSPKKVNQYFKENGYPLNKYWYEIGLAAGFVWSKAEQNWTRQAIKERDAGNGPKVVIWTFEKESTVKYWLNQGVDAILVNSSKAYGRAGAGSDADTHVDNAKKISEKNPNIKYGTPRDNPFLLASNRAAEPAPVKNKNTFPKIFKLYSVKTGKPMMVDKKKKWVYVDGRSGEKVLRFSRVKNPSGSGYALKALGIKNSSGKPMWLSCRNTTGAVKLYDSPKNAFYEFSGDLRKTRIKNTYHKQYLWVYDDSDLYISGTGASKKKESLWRVVDPTYHIK